MNLGVTAQRIEDVCADCVRDGAPPSGVARAAIAVGALQVARLCAQAGIDFDTAFAACVDDALEWAREHRKRSPDAACEVVRRGSRS
jgi:hypothetical protein